MVRLKHDLLRSNGEIQMSPEFQMNPESIKWSVDNVHNKYLPSVLHLLVALARHYGIPKRLPSFVTIKVIQINVS